jgi:hypothetical protein
MITPILTKDGDWVHIVKFSSLISDISRECQIGNIAITTQGLTLILWNTTDNILYGI